MVGMTRHFAGPERIHSLEGAFWGQRQANEQRKTDLFWKAVGAQGKMQATLPGGIPEEVAWASYHSTAR